jgi:hypothetical protein
VSQTPGGLWEYDYVLNHTVDVGLLERLHLVALAPTDAAALTEHLRHHFRLPKVVLARTGRDATLGRYFPAGARRGPRGGALPATIVVAYHGPTAEVIVHEVAHHLVMAGLGLSGRHDQDFVNSLDRIAPVAAARLGVV